MINRFEEIIATNCLDQRKYYVPVFVCKLKKQLLENLNNFSLGLSEATSIPLPTSKVELSVVIVNGMQYLF